MATTSTYLLPYPILTDAVNVHGNIKSLADRLEVVLGTKSNLASPIFTGTVVTPAGTATSSPLTLTSGTLKTTPVGGSIEYDGDSAYITPDASAVGGRAVIPAMHYYRLDAVRSLTNALGVQSLFGVSFTAAASTTYDFEIVTSVNTTGAVSNSLAFGFGGTAGVTACTYLAVTTNGLANITPNASSSVLIQTASSTAITAAVAAATQRVIRISGNIRVSTTGTLIPQVSYSAAPGAIPTVLAGSFIKLTPVASSTTTTIGAWA